MKDSVVSVLWQLVLWPLTLTMMLVASVYRFLLRVGCHNNNNSHRFIRRDPPRQLRLVSAPFRLINPPLSLGTENLKASLGVGINGGAGRAVAAVAPAVPERCDGSSGGGGGGGRRQKEEQQTAGTAAGGTTTTADGTRAAAMLLVGNQSLLGLDYLAMLDEVCTF